MIGDNFSYTDVKSEWKDTVKESARVEEEEWEDDAELESKLNLNIAIKALEWKGKSCIATLFGFCNSKYFDSLHVKELFPKTYDMFHSGFLPEVELVRILDLDTSYKTQSKAGIFGRLVKPLYVSHTIKRKTIKIPKPKINYIDDEAVQVMKSVIAATKLKIDRNIAEIVADSGPEVLFIIDSMSSYDELLNDLFNIVYEDYLAKPKRDKNGQIIDSDWNKEFSYIQGINQKYYKIRNGWWIDTMRNKRDFAGFQIDTIKMEIKSDLWLDKEVESYKKKGKNPDDVNPYKEVWVPRSKFDLDVVLLLDNEKSVNELGKPYFTSLWVDSTIRMNSNQENDKNTEITQRIDLEPNSRLAAFQILEGLAPFLLGEVEKEDGSLMSDDELWLGNLKV